MLNISWLTQEAHNLHNIFIGIFYSLISSLLIIGIVIEYFKFPLGQVPSFGTLVGRALIAVILLVSYQEIANHVGEISDAISLDLGNLDKFDVVLKKMAEKVDQYSMDWLNARSWVVSVLSFLTYSFLFYAVIIAEVAHIFTWTLLYVFSPFLISLYVLPVTSGATKALYRSLFEVACWKIVWATLASLLWASVLIEMNQGSTMDFIKMICINLILGASILVTPWVVHALTSSGLSGLTNNFSGISSPVGQITPKRMYSEVKRLNHYSQSSIKFGGKVLNAGAKLGNKVNQLKAINYQVQPIKRKEKKPKQNEENV